MKDNCYTLTVTSEYQTLYKRLDQFLVALLKEQGLEISRQQIKNLFTQGAISSTSKKLELKKLPPLGTTLEIVIPPKKEATAQAENIPLDILYEDEHLIIINKQAGLVIHPAPGNETGTLVNAILHHCPNIEGIGDEKRPGIVHRLDKGTTGVMVVAKNQLTHNGLTKLFSTHDLTRKYEALVMGVNNSISGRLDAPIGRHPNNRLKMMVNAPRSKRALTYYKVLQEFKVLSHFELTLETGRTHQIRVHLSSLLKRSIFMDPLYGNPKQDLLRISENIAQIAQGYPYPFLHAKHLGFIHPITKQPLSFTTAPPPIFQEVLDAATNSIQ